MRSVYPDFPSQPGEPRGGFTHYAVTARLADGREVEVGEWLGDAERAGEEALKAYERYYRRAYVEVLLDGCAFAYVTHNPRTHEKTPFLSQPGFCWHHACGQVPPEQCGCGDRKR
ncbi:hypothetical protein [Streptomyces chartreusis]|uniref:hypothetical protein n=1 Tax=Streptomyces chartreusis TaxID=1969 RepID=UPI001678DE7E|nr:hypothetical protein [Streptomyces chartreusis]GGX55938.1 hypothetical protein GCM10010321_86490 [Streptomyces chartreusis]